jgi:hypothetical protein
MSRLMPGSVRESRRDSVQAAKTASDASASVQTCQFSTAP